MESVLRIQILDFYVQPTFMGPSGRFGYTCFQHSEHSLFIHTISNECLRRESRLLLAPEKFQKKLTDMNRSQMFFRTILGLVTLHYCGCDCAAGLSRSIWTRAFGWLRTSAGITLWWIELLTNGLQPPPANSLWSPVCLLPPAFFFCCR